MIKLDLELNDQEEDLLNLSLGLATSAAAFILKKRGLALEIIDLVLKINADNPKFIAKYGNDAEKLLSKYENFEDIFESDDSK
jgi:hypothetical protein